VRAAWRSVVDASPTTSTTAGSGVTCPASRSSSAYAVSTAAGRVCCPTLWWAVMNGYLVMLGMVTVLSVVVVVVGITSMDASWLCSAE
jgi:hypothetical protein